MEETDVETFFVDKTREDAAVPFTFNVLWVLFSFSWLTAPFPFLFSLFFGNGRRGKQLRNVAWLAFMPVGKSSGFDPGMMDQTDTILSVLWFPIGFFLALAHMIFAVFSFIGIITIPFGIEHLKIARAMLFPFATKKATMAHIIGVLFVLTPAIIAGGYQINYGEQTAVNWLACLAVYVGIGMMYHGTQSHPAFLLVGFLLVAMGIYMWYRIFYNAINE